MGNIRWIVAQSSGPLTAAAIMDRFDPRWVGMDVVLSVQSASLGFMGYILMRGND